MPTIIQVVIILVLLILLFVLIIPSSYKVTENVTPPINFRPPLKQEEHFDDFWYRSYGLNMYMSPNTNLPFWSPQFGSRRNMSYDVRGDIPIEKQIVSPWLQSDRPPPIINKPLWMVS
jgi:hypothetical protein